MASNTSPTRPLGTQMLRGAGIFQAIAAFPTMFVLGICAYSQLFYPQSRYYYFFADSICSILAASIVFIVYVQRKAQVSAYQTLVFEGVKSGVATVLWLWLILDSAFGPWRDDYWRGHEDVERRVKRAALPVILLLLLFYPPLVYVWMVYRYGKQEREGSGEGGESEGEAHERTPLFAER